jgi:hypothetical protein
VHNTTEHSDTKPQTHVSRQQHGKHKEGHTNRLQRKERELTSTRAMIKREGECAKHKDSQKNMYSLSARKTAQKKSNNPLFQSNKIMQKSKQSNHSTVPNPTWVLSKILERLGLRHPRGVERDNGSADPPPLGS